MRQALLMAAALRGAASLAELLTSLRRRRPPTEPLLRRKFDALSPSAVDALPFLVERAVVARHGRLSPHERDGVARAVTAFAAETAAESAHVHACGAVASEEAVGFARDQARHMLRIGLELRAAARRMQVPLIPIATDRHALAMAELAPTAHPLPSRCPARQSQRTRFAAGTAIINRER